MKDLLDLCGDSWLSKVTATCCMIREGGDEKEMI